MKGIYCIFPKQVSELPAWLAFSHGGLCSGLDRPQTAQMRHGTCGSACICLKMGMCDLAMCKKVLEKFHAHRDRCWPVREERAPEIVGGSASWETPASLNLNCTRFPFGKRKRSQKKPNRTEDVGYLTPPSTAKYR
jgi:hypothetical protein